MLIRDFIEDDIKFLWASAKERPESATEFHDKVLELIATSYQYAWIIEAPVKGKRKPVGVIYGVQSGPFIVLGDMNWFSWSSDRNKLEGAVKFLNDIRKKMLVLLYCNLKDLDFYVHIARYGVLRRVGKVHDVYKDGPATLFETRYDKRV